MEKNHSSGVDPDLAKARESTGIMEGADPDLYAEEDPAPATEVKQEEVKKPEPEPKKPEVKPEPEEEKGKIKRVEEPEEGEDDEEEKSSSERPAKPSKDPLKALFSQINELRTDIADLKKSKTATPEEKDAAEAIDDELKALADEYKADPAALAKLSSTLEGRLMKKLEESGFVKKDLDPEIKEKLTLLDTLQAERKEQEEKEHFNKEWTALIPSLKKQFPNATDAELAQAREEMDKIAHSEKGGVIVNKLTGKMKPYPLDYLLYQNQDAFSTILKVAPKKKAFEQGGREMVNTEELEGDIDLDPENMTPEKYKAHQRRKIGEDRLDDVIVIG